jgi:WD40 repeat protein
MIKSRHFYVKNLNSSRILLSAFDMKLRLSSFILESPYNSDHSINLLTHGYNTKMTEMALACRSGLVILNTDSPDEFRIINNCQTTDRVCYSRDGSLLVSSHHNRVVFWNAITYEPTGVVYEQKTSIQCIEFSYDNSLFAFGTPDCKAYLINPQSGECVMVLNHNDWVLCIRFSPDWSTIASCSGSRIILWNSMDYSMERTMQCEGYVFSLSYSIDSNTLVSGSGTDITLWNPKAGVRLIEFNTVDRFTRIKSLCFSPNGELLVTCSDRIRVWNSTTGEHLSEIEKSEIDVDHVHFSPDGTSLISCSYNGFIEFLDPITGECINTMNTNRQCFSFVVRPQGVILM